MALHRIEFDQGYVQYLQMIGIGGLRVGHYQVDDAGALEPPVDLRRAHVYDAPVSIGAFTYLDPDAFVSAVRMGRYCSVASGVNIGRPRHPTGWLTTSPLTYLRMPEFESYLRDCQPEWQRALPVADFDDRPITTIGNDVWIGADAFLKAGVTVGDGAIIGAKAVVTQDVPPYAIVAGAPARIIRYRFDEATIARLQHLAWWRCCLLDLAGLDMGDPERCLDAFEARIARGEVEGYERPPINLVEERARYDELMLQFA